MDTTGTSSSPTSGATLPNHRPFKFGKRAEDLQHHSPNRRGSVYWLSERTKGHAERLKASQQPEKIRERARKPINFVDHQGVTTTKGVQDAGQLRASADGGKLFLMDTENGRTSEGINLQCRVLIDRRYTCITYKHANTIPAIQSGLSGSPCRRSQ